VVKVDVADLSPGRNLCNLSLCKGLCKKELYRRSQPGSFASPCGIKDNVEVGLKMSTGNLCPVQ
jgi:hypothetical protein